MKYNAIKKGLPVILFHLLFSICNPTFAQTPGAISYQAAARDTAGNLITNQAISLLFSIHDSIAAGNIVYQETQIKTTNSLGLFTANIGEGSVLTGTFSGIDWGSGPKFMQVGLDASGGNTFVDMGTQQMLSVPYALHAANGNWNKGSNNNIYNSNSENVGIGTPSPASSAKLEVNSVSKGLLPPRMTSSQRDAISNPVAGLVVYCTNCCISGEMQLYNGAVWTNMVGGSKCEPYGVTICNQSWMAKNLDVAFYRNGDPIPQVTDATQWAALTSGAYCYYNNDSATYAATYGKLYNWFAVHDSRGLAPAGWHIPSDSEWVTLENCLGGPFSGGAMKEAGTAHWASPNAGATNASGFTGLPGGDRYIDGSYFQNGYYGFWWSSTEVNSINAQCRYLDWGIDLVNGDLIDKKTGLSVRCVRD